MNISLKTPVPILFIAAILIEYKLNLLRPVITILVASASVVTLFGLLSLIILYCIIYPVIIPLRFVHSTSFHSTLIDVEFSTTGGYNSGVPGGTDGMKEYLLCYYSYYN